MSDSSRRDFVRLGAALAALGAVGCQSTRTSEPTRPPSPEENERVWKAKACTPYEVGTFRAPGVCALNGPNKKTRFPDPDKYKDVETVHGMCQHCSTVCGITGYVKDGRLLKIEGNPNDPNSRGKLCARGHAALNRVYHPERLLYPLRRVGPRGSGQWKRITWDEAYTEVATRLKAVRESGKPEEFAFHQGRSRQADIVGNFLAAFGTNTLLNHRGLCSAARRAANLANLFESDWDLGDYENTKYILNFGSNMFEAHQGHIPGALRIQRGRFQGGAKLVTFDVRMSNTAGNSDEFFMPAPGTDGAIALAMAHTILKEKLYDKTFVAEWSNTSADEILTYLKDYTPEWAEAVSTVPAKDIVRIAREFAAAAPRATTMCNRGSSAHHNGFYNDRAIGLLNLLVGSVGKHGGWCWMWTGGIDAGRFPPPLKVKKPATPSLLADPPEFILANAWNTMRVGEIVYWYLEQERARIQVYMSYNLDSPLTWPEIDTTRNVLADESKIGFHVCISPFYSETASYADLILPWTTFVERWDVDARGAYNLKPYLSVRRPMIEPLGEAKDTREFLPEIARRVGGGMEAHFPEQGVEDYMREWTKSVPFDETQYKSAWDFLAQVGAFEDPQEAAYFEPYLRPLDDDAMKDTTVEEQTGIILKDGKGVGILHRGKPVRGFKTPSRKFEVVCEYVDKMARGQDVAREIAVANSKGRQRPEAHKQFVYDNVKAHPYYLQIPEHEKLDDDQLIMTSFKWNVHNHGRTANIKWCAEIVHSNPAWIHPDTAKKFGLQSGDWIEITGFRSAHVDNNLPGLKLGRGALKNKLEIPVVVTKSIHPRAIAISNSLGHDEYTNVAKAKRSPAQGGATSGMDQAGLRDPDWERNMWWEDTSGGDKQKWKRNTGGGWAQNKVLPVAPDYISGQQSFNDTVVTIRKIEL